MTTPSPSSPEFDFHLTRPGALIAALPAVLGFVPHRSLVLVTVDRGELGCVMRADLADDMTERVEHLVGLAAARRRGRGHRRGRGRGQPGLPGVR